MQNNNFKLKVSLLRKTKRELVDMYLYQINEQRRNQESILEMRYELNKLMLMVDSRNPLPESEKREILNNLQEAEKILKFNLDEIRKEKR